jgi:hypothetical protein
MWKKEQLLEKLEDIEEGVENLDESYRQYWKPKTVDEIIRMKEEAGEGFEHIWLIEPEGLFGSVRDDIRELQKSVKIGEVF